MAGKNKTQAAKDLWGLPFSISVVIPAYNESRRLPQTLREVHTFLEQNVRDFEIIVVDDGSTDDTVNVVKKLADKLTRVKLLTNKINRGKGAVVRQGLSSASGDYRLFMDADHSTNINELLLLPGLLKKGGNVFIGSRHLPQSQIRQSQTNRRYIAGRLANWIIKLVALPGIKDTQNGFKIFSAKAFKAIEPDLSLDGWLFDVEMLFVARKRSFRVLEFPIVWANENSSHLSLRRDLLATSGEFIIFLKNRLRGKY